MSYLKRFFIVSSRIIVYYGGLFPTIRKIVQVIFREVCLAFSKISFLAKNVFERFTDEHPVKTHRLAANYHQWYLKQLPSRLNIAKEGVKAFSSHHQSPKISIIIPVCDPQLKHLQQAIDSVRSQFYQNWELCIADDASTNSKIKELLRKYAESDKRIKIVFKQTRGHISEALNSGLSLATGDYIGFLDHDDRLECDALYWVLKTIIEYPSVKLLYSDEDKINQEGTFARPYFKPDWNKDLLLSQNYICHFLVLEKNLLAKLGGFDSSYNGSQDYDLILRATELCHENQIKHIPFVLYHWREHANSTALQIEAKPYAVTASINAVAHHLKRLNISATVQPAPQAFFWNQVQYHLPKKSCLVSIIIPTRNRCDLLKICIDSIQMTRYKNFEIIVVDNGSDEADDLAYLEEIAYKKIAQVIRIDIPFNYSRLNNMAAKKTKGEILLFLNNDIEILSPEWLDGIVSNCLRAEIGAVGVRLWYPNLTLQHGGVIIGQGGIAGHAHHGITKENEGYFGRAILQQNFSAVTGACMAIRREIFEQVNGFDEEFIIAFNDVDICLRIGERGYKITWIPFVELIHHESASRGKIDDTPEKQRNTRRECNLFTRRWKEILFKDPAYNPNLTLDDADFSLALNPRIDEFLQPLSTKITFPLPHNNEH